jgi:two-component system alkaline phosphatase synthesis response regulator PhoP
MSDRKKILVVDDDPDFIEQVWAVLASEGYEVFTAGGENEAREMLLMVSPDLAILDLMMEHKDSGFVLAHCVKKLHPGAAVILITSVAAVTGMSFAPQSAEARTWVKTERVLDKPIRPEQLKEEVRKLLDAPKAMVRPA